jgi:hypothetical protein
MAFTVEQVLLDPAAGERLAGFAVELPAAGQQGDLHVLRIAGWVAGREVRPRAVEVVYHGRPIQIAPVRGARPDVAAIRPDVDATADASWDALVGLVGLRRDAMLELRVVLDGDVRVPAATLELRRESLRSGFDAQVQPLVLSSLGRSGSTWLMKMFAAHPEVVTMRRFPYESSPGKYWMHAMKVLSDPASLELSAHMDTFHSDRSWAGSNPYFDAPAIDDPERGAWLGREQVERLARFFQDTVEQWYLTVARSQGQDSPRYFAEKHLWPNFLPMLIRELYPGAREIFLVRDFRDVACSALAADARRGYSGFGREPHMSEAQYVREVVHRMATDLHRSWEARAPGAHLVRYEDMALQPRETLTSLFEFLGVEATGGTVDRVLALASEDVPDLPGSTSDPELVERHRDDRSPEDSIGRWRERDEGFREVLDEALGEALSAFGYDRAGRDSGHAAGRSAAQPAVD